MQTAQKSPTDSTDSTDASPRQLLSEWLDGESPLSESFNLTQVNRDTWDTYHLIGDVMRSSDLATQPSAAFQTRLSRALDAELPIVAAPRRAIHHPWRLGLSGAAVAAAVATVVWVSQPYFGGTSNFLREGQVLADASTQPVADDSSLSAYLEAHRQMAGPSAVRQVSFEPAMGR